MVRVHARHRASRTRALGKRPARWLRLRLQSRKASAVLAGGSILAGFGLTFGILQSVRGGDPSDAGQGGPGAGARVISNSGGSGVSPARLDAQWLAYSDDSTCADWSGGDGVSAVRLSSSQIAWFFADTFLGPAGPKIGFSRLSGFVHNSVVMQTTTGSQSSLVTLTGGGGCASRGDPGPPLPVVPAPDAAEGSQRAWDADGIRVGSSVVTFYNTYLLGPVPYVPTGTTIASFSAAQLSTDGRADRHVITPRLTSIPAYTPFGGGTPIMWGTALVTSGSTVYVYGWQSPSVAGLQRLLYVARVSAGKLADFGAWSFYAGRGRWVASQNLAVPIEPTTQDLVVPAGFSVAQIAGRYWLIQAVGAGDPDIYAYPASEPWGPFKSGSGILLYRAPGIGLNAASDYRVLYDAQAEPALSTSKTLVISYDVNSEAVTGACESIAHFTNAIIQPRFIAVPRSAFTTSAASVQGRVRAAPPTYPPIVQQNPKQWFDAWSYPSGCPPVPGVSGIRAQAAAGQARVTWQSAGIGMRYRIYLNSGPGSPGFVRTVSSPLVTLTGLASGATYEVRVVPESIHGSTGPAAETSVRIP
jgi:hypothetical protein